MGAVGVEVAELGGYCGGECDVRGGQGGGGFSGNGSVVDGADDGGEGCNSLQGLLRGALIGGDYGGG